jgi:hypothetical protein
LRTPTSSCTIRRSLLASFPAPEKEREKKKEEKGKGKKKIELLGFRECFFSFLLKPWRNRTGPLPRLCSVTYKAS